MDELYIPMDDAIDEFHKHLLSHPRTILSARYGDGKSFFLQEFEKNPAVNAQFVFLTLFPVNYQVVENKDIFELIKYDLLFQLFDKGLLNDESDASISDLLYAFASSNKKDIALLLSEIGAMVGVLPAKLTNVIEKLSNLHEKWKELQDGNGNPDLARFTKDIEKHYLYEADPVTSFIQRAISQYKEKEPERRVVLLIEDMDRLDPAHLFRILNVLSAHIDYAYRYGLSLDRETVVGNKFGVDNVVLVLDYDNTKNIYGHFYGENARFDGYINKFISHGYFRYSLAQEQCKYYAEYLFKETKLKSSLIQSILPDTFYSGHTVRDIANAVRDTQSQLFDVPKYKDLNNEIELPKGILQLLVVMRRLGKTDEEIAQHLEKVIV